MLVDKTFIFSHEANLNDYINECQNDPLWSVMKKFISDGSLILEAGAGSGKWLAFLTKEKHKAVGIELNHDSVKRFHKEYEYISYSICDVAHLFFKNDTFDVIMSLGVLEHLIDGPEDAIKEMYRVIKKNGYIFVTIPVSNLLWKIEKLIDVVRYSIYSSNLIRKIIGRKTLVYSKEQQKKYINEFHERRNKNIDYKLGFHPSRGVYFYEYRYNVEQIRKLLAQANLETIEYRHLYSEHRLYHVFSKSIGRYKVGEGVRLNSLGRIIKKLTPNSWISHMVLFVVRKNEST